MGEAQPETQFRFSEGDARLIAAYNSNVPLSEDELFRLAQLGVLDKPPRSEDQESDQQLAA